MCELPLTAKRVYHIIGYRPCGTKRFLALACAARRAPNGTNTDLKTGIIEINLRGVSLGTTHTHTRDKPSASTRRLRPARLSSSSLDARRGAAFVCGVSLCQVSTPSIHTHPRRVLIPSHALCVKVGGSLLACSLSLCVCVITQVILITCIMSINYTRCERSHTSYTI